MNQMLKKIEDKIKNGKRLSFEEGVYLYKSPEIIKIGQLADFVRKAKYGRKAFFIYNQHINYTNICSNKCLFCAYAKDEGEDGAYSFSLEDIKNEVLKRKDEPIKEYHIVGGLNKNIGFDYYFDMLRLIKKLNPKATLKAFTAVEIDYLSKISNLSIDEVFKRLKDAGLEMMPGGGAEVLSDRIHKKLFPKKINKDKWLKIIEKAHQNGITTNATMLYGHIETIEERVNHLILLRELQDKTNGFSAFIPLEFHPENTRLSQIKQATILEDLKTIAVSRLMLDNFPHIKAYWVMLGEETAQLALSFGADDLDGTIIEEKITHTAGAKSAKGLTKQSIEKLIEGGGFIPQERNSFYEEINN